MQQRISDRQAKAKQAAMAAQEAKKIDKALFYRNCPTCVTRDDAFFARELKQIEQAFFYRKCLIGAGMVIMAGIAALSAVFLTSELLEAVQGHGIALSM